MTILCSSGVGGPLSRAHASVLTFTFQHLAGLDCTFGDLRWAIVTLLSHSLNAAGNSLVENIAGRAWQGARFAQRITAADTMMAAGER